MLKEFGVAGSAAVRNENLPGAIIDSHESRRLTSMNLDKGVMACASGIGEGNTIGGSLAISSWPRPGAAIVYT